ncbi:MAG: SDR family oxidoreductase [Dehalococcoidia bacterium]|nr:SDR family oxidoreductase [Dehalococcoidia bacterium]
MAKAGSWKGARSSTTVATSTAPARWPPAPLPQGCALNTSLIQPGRHAGPRRGGCRPAPAGTGPGRHRCGSAVPARVRRRLCRRHHGQKRLPLPGQGLQHLPGKGLLRSGPGPAHRHLHMLTRYLAKECAPEVRVNAISPGGMRPEPPAEGIVLNPQSRNPMQRTGYADDIVGAPLYLASGASSYVTGTVLFVDGGHTATVT